MARERIMQLDGALGAAAGAADRAAELRALARHRSAIAAKLSRQADGYARRAARGDSKAAVMAVRAGEAQAAAEVLALNAGLQAELAAQIAAGHRVGAVDAVRVLEDAFNLLADQSETIAPADGSAVGFGLSGAWVLQPDGRYVWDEAATSQLAAEHAAESMARAAQGAPAIGLLPPGTAATVDLAAQRAAQDAAIAARSACTYSVVEDLDSLAYAAWQRAIQIAESARGTQAAASVGDPALIRSGQWPFRLVADCWETWDERTRTHKIFHPPPSFVEKLPGAIADGFNAIADAAQAAADLACQIASNTTVQAAADKIGKGATKAIKKAAEYGCGGKSGDAEEPVEEKPKIGAGVVGIGLLALLAAVL